MEFADAELDSQLLVEEGAEVQVGEPIARVGSSGNTTLPRLHLQVQTHPDAWDPENRSVLLAFGRTGAVLSRNDVVTGSAQVRRESGGGGRPTTAVGFRTSSPGR